MVRFPVRFALVFAALAAVGSAASAGAPQQAAADPMLARFDYGWPVRRHAFAGQGEALVMAYIDAAPARPNGRTVVLLHGKNFCAGTWDVTIRALTGAGYRVVAPDQIGFCKSTKPGRYQYGLHTLAANTHGLLAALGVDRPIIMGHSMGGMLAARYALQYPRATGALVLVNPIGLEDWRAKGVPNVTLDQLYAAERRTTAASIKAYQRATYYGGAWRPAYDRWVNMLASMYQGKGGEIAARHQALTSDMVFNQPVVHEFGRIAVPALLLIGERDTTAIGKDRAPPDLRARLGDYRALGRAAAAAIPRSRLIAFDDLGHSPQVEAPDRFHARLLPALEALRLDQASSSTSQ